MAWMRRSVKVVGGEVGWDGHYAGNDWIVI